MTKDRQDLPTEAIAWDELLWSLADAESFSAMAELLYPSGVMLSDYRSFETSDADPEDVIETGDVMELRALLTSLVRDDHFSAGEGDRSYWDGQIDDVLDALASGVESIYPLPLPEYVLPRRVPPCPTCGKVDRLQFRLVGMPPAPPPGFDESRVIFAGCMVSHLPEPSFRCERCSVDFDPPGYAESESWVFEDLEVDR